MSRYTDSCLQLANGALAYLALVNFNPSRYLSESKHVSVSRSVTELVLASEVTVSVPAVVGSSYDVIEPVNDATVGDALGTRISFGSGLTALAYATRFIDLQARGSEGDLTIPGWNSFYWVVAKGFGVAGGILDVGWDPQDGQWSVEANDLFTTVRGRYGRIFSASPP